MRFHVIARKSLEDFTSVKVLLLFFVPFLLITGAMVSGLTDPMPDNLDMLPLETQENELLPAFIQFAILWGAGIPLMVLIAILAANTIAKEEESGTLRILLSKPVSRTAVIGGKFAAIFVFSLLVTTAGLLAGGSLLFIMSGAAPQALSGSLFQILLPTLLYAVLIAFFTASIGTFLAAFTANRLQTGLLTAGVAVLFFAFIPIRFVTQVRELYEPYRLYLLDFNYHFGNILIYLYNLMDIPLQSPVQQELSFAIGVFADPGGYTPALLGGLPATLEPVDHIAPELSLAVIVVLSLLFLITGILHFNRKDIQ